MQERYSSLRQLSESYANVQSLCTRIMFELTKVDLVDKRNTELKDEIQKIFTERKGRYGCTPCRSGAS